MIYKPSGINYLKQKDMCGCGPTAIINIFKWLGHKVSYDFIHIARWACDWQDGRSDFGGIDRENFEKALNYFEIKNTRVVQPNTSILENHIKNNGCFAVSYFGKSDTGHISLCIDMTKDNFIMINDFTKKTIGRRSKAKLQEKIKKEQFELKSWTWLVNK